MSAKNIILTIIFVVVVVGLIWFGIWYNAGAPTVGSVDNSGSQSAVAVGSSTETQTTTSTQNMDGLIIKDDVVGTGTVAQAGDSVSVLYTGKLDNGTVFDASSLHGNVPFTFTLGTIPPQVIQGWDTGLLGMRVGGTRELTIPPNLAYGANGISGVIPANATLHFTVQLLGVSSTAQ